MLTLSVVLLLSCHHSFPPEGGETDSADRDRDGSVDLAVVEAGPDRPRRDFPVTEAGPLDFSVPDCGAGLGDPVATPDLGGADLGKDPCSSLLNWTCKGCGDSFHRMVCYVNSEIRREIWCDDTECRCRTEEDAVPIPCLEIIDNGRIGCGRCLDAFKQGCCAH